MSEPMSDETLEELDELLHNDEQVPNKLVRQLADEVERLRAENAAMRPVVEAVAKATHAGGNSTVAYISDLLIHQARAILSDENNSSNNGD